MKVTKLGIITAVKNLAMTFLLGFSVPQIRANPYEFLYALTLYAMVSVPTDLYLLNRAHENGKKKVETSKKEVET